MSIDFESLSDVLKHNVRRRIILALYERKSMSYVDLMNFVEVNNTRKFNYHLKILGDLIRKDQNGKYSLTENGQMAALILQKFPEKVSQRTILSMADAVVVGFVGVALTVVNPVFWASCLIMMLKLELNVPYFVVIGLLTFSYALVVPGATMWVLTVKRTNSHEMYDLLKPPLAAFILLLVILIAMSLLGINMAVTITSPKGSYDGVQYHSIMHMDLQMLLFWGLILSFVGVLIAELASRLRRRIMLQ